MPARTNKPHFASLSERRRHEKQTKNKPLDLAQFEGQSWKWEDPREFDHKASSDHPAYHWYRVFMGDGSTVAYTPEASTAAILCESERIRAERNRQREQIEKLRQLVADALNGIGPQEWNPKARALLRELGEEKYAAKDQSSRPML